MSEGSAILARPVRPGVLAHHGGQLMLMAAAGMAVPAVAAVLLGDRDFALIQSAATLALAASGGLLHRVPAQPGMQRNEALVLVALAFVLMATLSSLALHHAGMPGIDALFEAVSGITTTGLSTLSDPGAQSRAVQFARSWLQWYGGLGVIVFAIALAGGQGIAGKRLYAPVESQPIEHSTRAFARRMLLAYVTLSAAGWMVLTLQGSDPFTALLHIMSAVSTGGFSPFANNLQDLPDWTGRYLVIVFCLAGALPLAVVIESGLRASGRDVEIKALLSLCVVIALLLAWRIATQLQLPWREALLEGGLLSVSAQSTTGFSVLAPARLDDMSKLLLCIAMLTGGCVGSTAGGIKLLRLLILGRVVQTWFMRTALPERAVVPQRIGGMPLTDDDVRQALILISLFTVALLGSWLAFLACGYPAMDSLFEVSSALATTGLSTGITAAQLPAGLKLLLCLDMLLGRVELFALLVLLYPRTWHQRR